MKAPRFTLRTKLALLSLLLLALPLISFRHAVSVSSLLLESRQDALTATAEAIAAIIAERPELFAPPLPNGASGRQTVGAHPLQHAIRLDGNTDDWGGLLQQSADFGPSDSQGADAPFNPRSLSVKFLSGRYADSLYLLFMVEDDKVVYRERNSMRFDGSDHLQIALENGQGLLDYYVISPSQPGRVTAYLVLGGRDNSLSVISEKRIQAVWKETDGGYLIEMGIPLQLMTDRVSFAIADYDDPVRRDLQMVIGPGGFKSVAELGILLAKSPELERVLAGLQRPATRIWVIDRQNGVRAVVGSLEAGREDALPEKSSVLDAFLSRSIRHLARLFHLSEEEAASPARPPTDGFNFDRIGEVLAGKGFTALRPAGQGEGQIVAVAEPLRIGKEIEGAVVVEQATDTILSTRNRMIWHLLVGSTVVFLIGAAVLLFFAARLSGRIRRLRSGTDRAIAGDGRIVGAVTPIAGSDELGDLSRHLAAMLHRLREYNQHQEKMADHLEHEMRTPLAGVSAALTNLSQQLGPDHPAVQEYLLDARKNMQRLESILTGIREAATIKDALRQDEPEKFDLGAALRTWVESYRKMFAKVRFSLQTPEDPILVTADPNRIFQMMDKLVENAVDFSPADATVGLRLAQDGESAVIAVANEGPRLGEGRADRLFHSMVSERSSRSDDKTHMGLGLFIVRSIVEFNGGQVQAANRTDGTDGAVFTVRLPRHSWIKDISIQK